ncbi:MAG: diaminopimelate epimerase [Rhodospirillaceae bacterium]|nr:diaminopimelate epimerase [Rhodospirillaceae bacterium]
MSPTRPAPAEPRAPTFRPAGFPFVKMHGAGNDFVVLDLRDGTAAPCARTAARIADRHRGVGCDQLVIVTPPPADLADYGLAFLNSDGSESGACGNGTRCAAALLMGETGKTEISFESIAGVLDCQRNGDGSVAVDMGRPATDWREIPLSEDRDTLHLGIAEGPLRDPVGIGMGNPHAVFFVDDADAVPIAVIGPRLEHHRLFPERANVGVAQVKGRDRLRLRVWERGAGLTQACGSGACAAVVAAVRRGLTGRRVAVEVDGGELFIDWAEDDHVLMSGPTATSFRGVLA